MNFVENIFTRMELLDARYNLLFYLYVLCEPQIRFGDGATRARRFSANFHRPHRIIAATCHPSPNTPAVRLDYACTHTHTHTHTNSSYASAGI